MNHTQLSADDDLFERTDAALQAWPQGLQASALDGFLCGVLLQPGPVQEAQWLPWVLDAEGGQAPTGKAPPAAVQALLDLARQRRAQLNQAIAARQWFDPWLVEPQEDPAENSERAPGGHGQPGAPGEPQTDQTHQATQEHQAKGARESALPWAAGFALAMQAFPALMDLGDEALLEPLALVFLHFEPDDLEDADELIEQIQELEPPDSLAQAAEDLVRAVLLMADVTRPKGAGTKRLAMSGSHSGAQRGGARSSARGPGRNPRPSR